MLLVTRSVFIHHGIKKLWAEGKGKKLIAIAIGWGLLIGTRMIYPVLLPHLSANFDLTLTTTGLLITIVWIGYAVGQVPGGILADRYGERKILTTSVAISILGLLLVVSAPNLVVLFTATGLIGLGISLYPVARITILSDFYPDRIGRALGVTMATGDIGQTVLPPIAGVLAAAIAWQAGLIFVIPPLILSMIMIWIFLPEDTPTESGINKLSIKSIKRVFADSPQDEIMNMSIILCLYLTVLQTVSAFYPTYLISVKGFSSAAASGLFGLFFAVGIVAKPLGGIAYDKIGTRKSLPIVLSGSIIGLSALPVVKGFWPLVIVTILISTMLGSGAITQSYLSDSIPEEVQGTGLGTIRSAASMVGALGPVLFGALADQGYFDEGYILLAVIVGVNTVLVFRFSKT